MDLLALLSSMNFTHEIYQKTNIYLFFVLEFPIGGCFLVGVKFQCWVRPVRPLVTPIFLHFIGLPH